MENLRLRVDIRLVNKWNGRCGARMLIAKPNFKQCRIFDESLVAIEMRRTHLLMNKPIAVGMCILDVSKLTMYSFLYDFLKPKYDKIDLCYVDTDAFILDVQTDDFYKDMCDNIHMFDTSDYPYPNVYNIPLKNKKIPGLFKDELKGMIMVQFVGLRSKCYSILSLDEFSKIINKIKKSKGVRKNVVENKIKFAHYVECIEKNCEIVETQNAIRSIKHRVFTIEQQKIALSPFDDKRYLLSPKYIRTLSWGHYNIKNLEKLMKKKRKINKK